MTFLPVVARELRVASRRRATYWSRFATAVITIVLGVFVYFSSRRVASHELGTNLFAVISIAAFIYCLATGVRSTADCLSEEKREGTLGLLFLTDLKGYDVVGGKLVATSLNAFYGLMAIFPVMAIPLLLGGITNGEFWRMALVLANTFFLSLAMGMFMSSVCTSPRKAMAGTFIAMFMLSAGFPILEQIFSAYIYRSHQWLLQVLATINPDAAFVLVQDGEYSRQWRTFWWSVGIIHGMCWAMLGIASFIVPRSWQDRPPGEKQQLWRDRWHRWSFGDAGERVAFRRRLLDINAFYWLAGRARLKPAHVWVVFFLIGCLWMWGALDQGKSWLNDAIYLLTALVLNTTLKIWVASEAGRRLGEDRKMGSLELLLSTPLTVRDILRGQILALKRQFLGPIVVALVIQAVFLVASLQEARADSDEVFVTTVFGLMIMGLLVADILALIALAMWTSLTAKNPNRTTGITVRRILVLPWVINIVVALVVTMANLWGHSGGPSSKFFLGLYLCTSLAADLVFGLGAWQRLNSEFREVATQRFTAGGPSWLRSLFSRPEKAATPAPAMPQGEMMR